MDSKLAKRMLFMVNDPACRDCLIAYAEHRVSDLLRQLEAASSWDRVRELQGQLKEARRFLNLRDEVRGVAEHG